MVENLSQDDRIDQLGLATSWGVSPLDDSNRWGAALYGVNQSFYQLLRVECLEGNLPSTENELAISQTLAKKTGWKIGDQVSLDLLRVWTPQGVDSAGEMIYRQTSGPGIMGLSDSYMLRSVGEKQFTITAIVDPGGFDDQNVFAWEPCFTVLEDQIPRMDCGALIILSVRWGENCMTCWKVSRNGRQTCLSMLEAWGPSI